MLSETVSVVQRNVVESTAASHTVAIWRVSSSSSWREAVGSQMRGLRYVMVRFSATPSAASAIHTLALRAMSCSSSARRNCSSKTATAGPCWMKMASPEAPTNGASLTGTMLMKMSCAMPFSVPSEKYPDTTLVGSRVGSCP